MYLYEEWKLYSVKHISPCPSDPGYILYVNIVDPDQLVSDEAIWLGSTLFTTLAAYNWNAAD